MTKAQEPLGLLPDTSKSRAEGVPAWGGDPPKRRFGGRGGACRPVMTNGLGRDSLAQPRRLLSVSPIVAGVEATLMPAASSASIFSAAVPLPPEMIAPA